MDRHAALRGTTLRERLKSGTPRLPAPDRYRACSRRCRQSTSMTPAGTLTHGRPHHAAMLATVLPDAGGRLDEIVGRLSTRRRGRGGDRARRPPPGATRRRRRRRHRPPRHRRRRCGDRLDDVATLVGHLRFRAASSADPRVDDYAVRVRNAFSGGFDDADVDRHVAAVLVGLATGPFRIQRRWEARPARPGHDRAPPGAPTPRSERASNERLSATTSSALPPPTRNMISIPVDPGQRHTGDPT